MTRKFVVFSMSVLVCAASAALAQSVEPIGTFAYEHSVVVLNYDASNCQSDGGKWDQEEETCLFEGEDTVSVEATGCQEYAVKLETVTTNGHTCSFEGKTVLVEDNRLVAKAESCEVTLEYADNDTVSVSDNGKCRNYCGARATLEISTAKRRD